MIAGKSHLRHLTGLIVIAVLCIATGCDKPDTTADEGVDRQTCLGSELAPIEALAACSRFIAVTSNRTLSRSDAYYNRGVAFAGLGELHHARLDFEDALKLDPRNQWARQRLESLKQTPSQMGN